MAGCLSKVNDGVLGRILGQFPSLHGAIMDFHHGSSCGRRDIISFSHSPTSRPALELSQRPVVGEAGVAGVLQKQGHLLGSGF